MRRNSSYLGDANLINRPDGLTASPEEMHDYVYLRTNPAGEHRELWYHEQGDRSWLVVTRNTVTHEIYESGHWPATWPARWGAANDPGEPHIRRPDRPRSNLPLYL